MFVGAFSLLFNLQTNFPNQFAQMACVFERLNQKLFCFQTLIARMGREHFISLLKRRKFAVWKFQEGFYNTIFFFPEAFSA
jgi:hypothetical protein